MPAPFRKGAPESCVSPPALIRWMSCAAGDASPPLHVALCSIVVNVQGRTKVRRLDSFEKRESTVGLFFRCLDRHMKAAEIDWPAFPWPKNERPAHASPHSVTSTLLESGAAWSVMGSRFGRKEAGPCMAPD